MIKVSYLAAVAILCSFGYCAACSRGKEGYIQVVIVAPEEEGKD